MFSDKENSFSELYFNHFKFSIFMVCSIFIILGLKLYFRKEYFMLTIMLIQ